jgi:hypothetical protein
VAKEADTRKVTQRIAELMYAVLLRDLGYSEDFDIAELEIELETEGKLPEFVATCKTLLNKAWETVRAGAQKLSRASAILHELDPKLYPSADSWSYSQRNRDASISVSKVVKRTFDLWGRRRQGKALVFIIDEPTRRSQRRQDRRLAGDHRGVRQDRQELAQRGQDHRSLLDRGHVPRKAGRGGLPPSIPSGSNWRSCRIASTTVLTSPPPTSGKWPPSAFWRRKPPAELWSEFGKWSRVGDHAAYEAEGAIFAWPPSAMRDPRNLAMAAWRANSFDIASR